MEEVNTPVETTEKLDIAEEETDLWGDERNPDTEPIAAEEEPKDEPKEETEEPDKPDEETEKFTVKVLGEEKQLTRDELIANAQKGIDYDRVKQERDEIKSSLGIIARLAKDNSMSVPEYITAIEQNFEAQQIEARKEALMEEGMEEEAAQRLAQTERENQKLKEAEQAQTAQEDVKKKVEAEFADFLKKTGLTELTDDIAAKMNPYVKDKSMSFTEAYYAVMADDAKAAAQAAQQTQKNKQTTPGSVKGRTKQESDDMIDALMNG